MLPFSPLRFHNRATTATMRERGGWADVGEDRRGTRLS